MAEDKAVQAGGVRGGVHPLRPHPPLTPVTLRSVSSSLNPSVVRIRLSMRWNTYAATHPQQQHRLQPASGPAGLGWVGRGARSRAQQHPGPPATHLHQALLVLPLLELWQPLKLSRHEFSHKFGHFVPAVACAVWSAGAVGGPGRHS